MSLLGISNSFFGSSIELIQHKLSDYFVPEAVTVLQPFLQGINIYGLPDGHYPLLLDKTDSRELIYANCDATIGKGETGRKLEAHKQFVDIHIVIDGSDRIGLFPKNHAPTVETEYDSQKDIIWFSSPPSSYIDLLPGMAAIIPPDLCHLPLAGRGPLTKLVIKIDILYTR